MPGDNGLGRVTSEEMSPVLPLRGTVGRPDDGCVRSGKHEWTRMAVRRPLPVLARLPGAQGTRPSWGVTVTKLEMSKWAVLYVGMSQ